ncbi:hypothetical protein Y1Q_0000705 [Alligator mississippiensis]|uniref:Secreted protein n=1 Tax=Alligator mississippiensis TaxID=8496 RepID=A0A151MC34_ALLMI|nr:hypothetical protein Y1Q_0000705 [Alligator mississippiensis]
MFQRSSTLGWILSVLSSNILRRSVSSKPAASDQGPCRRYTIGLSSYREGIWSHSSRQVQDPGKSNFFAQTVGESTGRKEEEEQGDNNGKQEFLVHFCKREYHETVWSL